jgi:hypothetical protein
VTGEEFFIWIRRNPLKAPIPPKKIKEIQAIFLGFIWICLDFLGRICGARGPSRFTGKG